MNKRVKFSAILEGSTFIQGAMFIFLLNVPGAMFIQGGTFIPDSRV